MIKILTLTLTLLMTCSCSTLLDEAGSSITEEPTKPHRSFSVTVTTEETIPVVAGRQTCLSQKGVLLEITNMSLKNQFYKVESVRLNGHKEGYRQPDPTFLIFSDTLLRLEAGQTGAIKMGVTLPDEEEYRNDRYVFGIRVSWENIHRDLPLYVSTK